ncbi:tetratricopeptide repeat protein [Marinifilum sp. D714]|uniref:tetratricopeptide repeat-containing sensor histidine kinase n=1 Tax=Marinifilum sp. D714 TaxID=2937523 RepID=UPI0027CB9511|nr:tetratricopeptide repeat protein [Marinifilum sp. D714]MDQ2179943.1 tetratricopeptide repeat protein [Marinifilum sp. D714]
MLKTISTVVLLLISYTSFGYFNNDDKESNKNLQERITTYLDSSSSLLRNNSLTKSIEVCNEAILLAEETEDPVFLSKAYKRQGINYFYSGNTDSSFYYYNKAIPQFEALGSKVDVGKVTGNIGLLYKSQGQYDKALEFYLENLQIYKEVKYDKGLGSVYNNLGNLHQLIKNLEYAEDYYMLALKSFQKHNNSLEVAKAYCNLGAVCEKLEEYSKGLEYYEMALKENAKINNKLLDSKLYFNIGYLYQSNKQLDSALVYLKKSEKLRTELENFSGLVNVKLQLGSTYFELRNYALSEKYLLEALDLAKRLENHLLLPDILFQLSSLYKDKKQYKQAYDYQFKGVQLKDSLNIISIENKFAELAAAYENEKKKQEFELLQQRTQIQNLELGQKNAWIIVLLVVMILGVVAVLVSLRINRMRADHKIMDLRQKVLLTQMNPHFLFNSLTAIQSFILDEKNDDANNYLSRLASLVRGILENSREEFVSLRKEIQTLEDYIRLQKLRFENDICYNFEIDATLNQDEVMIPPMLAQPFIENALIHGKLRNNPEACINVQISKTKDEQSIKFDIIDNGIGIEEAKKQSSQTNHKSLATSIALDRVKIYNFKSSKKMNFEILDLKSIDPNKSGTKVSYSIPIIISSK